MAHEPLPPLSPQAKALVPGGIYEHFKKLRYKVIAMARHSETLEEMVVYQQLYGDGAIWVRPLGMFFEQVEVDGVCQSRFTCVEGG